jgi:hypothetical protein
MLVSVFALFYFSLGLVARSKNSNRTNASLFVCPHISSEGRKRTHTSGRSGLPKSRQRLSCVSCTQRTPAGFPAGMPGIGEEIDGTMQHAPQPTRHSIGILFPNYSFFLFLLDPVCRIGTDKHPLGHPFIIKLKAQWFADIPQRISCEYCELIVPFVA